MSDRPIPRPIELLMQDGTFDRAVVVEESSLRGLKCNWHGVEWWQPRENTNEYREIEDAEECARPEGVGVDDLSTPELEYLAECAAMYEGAQQ